jgi:DNA-binding transcriptional LysR family regulator
MICVATSMTPPPCGTAEQEKASVMTIELRHIRYVITAADTGSFRRAAKSLNIQESAVSRRVRDLEDQIGAALFIRHSGGVILTQAGEIFLRHARRALKQISHATIDVGAIGRGENGVIRIGIFSSLASGFLAHLLRAFSTSHCNVSVEIIEGAPNDHIAAVRQHQLDVAFLTGLHPIERCDFEQFWTERIFVVLPRAHPLSKARVIQWGDLQDQRFVISEGDPGPEIQDFLVKHLADLGIHPDIQRIKVGRDNLMQIVSFGQGLTLTSEATIATRFPGIVYKRLYGETLPFRAVWSPRNDNPAFRRFLSMAIRTARYQIEIVGFYMFRGDVDARCYSSVTG